jgi:hypothetical protein
MLDHSRIIRPGLLPRRPWSSNVRAVELRCGSTWQNVTGKSHGARASRPAPARSGSAGAEFRLNCLEARTLTRAIRAYSSIGQSPRLITGLFLVRTQVGPLCHLVAGALARDMSCLVAAALARDMSCLVAGALARDSSDWVAGALARDSSDWVAGALARDMSCLVAGALARDSGFASETCTRAARALGSLAPQPATRASRWRLHRAFRVRGGRCARRVGAQGSRLDSEESRCP